jgi:hypothetical protein
MSAHNSLATLNAKDAFLMVIRGARHVMQRKSRAAATARARLQP